MASTFEVWLTAFEPIGAARAAAALSATFQIEHDAARHLLFTVPCRVSAGVTAEDARRIAEALMAIGGHAQIVASDHISGPTYALPKEPEAWGPAALPLASQQPPAFQAEPPAQASPPRPGPEPVMRDPTLRARSVRPRPKSSRPPAAAKSSSAQALDSLKLAAAVLEDAERSSWQNALRGHPVMGFLFVITATTLAYLALYAVVRSFDAAPTQVHSAADAHGHDDVVLAVTSESQKAYAV